jgi:hypothetical protein
MTRALARIAVAAVAGSVFLPASVEAQLDPLLFLKTTQPYVILAVDTANRMQHDADNTFYDPGRYLETDQSYEAVMGLQNTEAHTYYRRKYFNLEYETPSAFASDKFRATRIAAIGDQEPAGQDAAGEPDAAERRQRAAGVCERPAATNADGPQHGAMEDHAHHRADEQQHAHDLRSADRCVHDQQHHGLVNADERYRNGRSAAAGGQRFGARRGYAGGPAVGRCAHSCQQPD